MAVDKVLTHLLLSCPHQELHNQSEFITIFTIFHPTKKEDKSRPCESQSCHTCSGLYPLLSPLRLVFLTSFTLLQSPTAPGFTVNFSQQLSYKTVIFSNSLLPGTSLTYFALTPTLSVPFKLLIKDTNKWHIPKSNGNIPIHIWLNLLAAFTKKIFIDQQLYARHCSKPGEKKSDQVEKWQSTYILGGVGGYCS